MMQRPTISVRLSAEIQGVAIASRNADAQSMIDTADGALGETHSLLRMRELAVQSANGTLNDDRDALDAEYQQLEAEIDRIDSNTTFAGTSLFDGNAKFSGRSGSGGGNSLSHTFASMGSRIS